MDRNVLDPLNRPFLEVATREGGVDRNELSMEYPVTGVRRHPRGWRG